MTRRLLVLAVAATAVWFAWRQFFPGDEAQIASLLERIAAAVEGEGAEGSSGFAGVGGIAGLAVLQEDFALDATVDAGAPFQQLRGRQSIVAAAARVRVATRNLDIRFPEVDISVADDRRTATAMVVAEAHFDADGSRSMDARELEMRFSRVDGRWMVSSVEVLQPLNSLP